MSSKNDGANLVLDMATLGALDRLSERWGISREAAVRRAIAQAAPETAGADAAEKLQALKELQHQLQLTPAKAAAWQESVRDARP
jgi:hypothetical protein